MAQAQAAASNGLRRRNADEVAAQALDGPIGRAQHVQQSPATLRKFKLAVALAVTAVLLLVLTLSISKARVKDSWGNISVLQRACAPPSPSKRHTVWGDLNGFSHPIITGSSEAQEMFNQGLLLAWDFNRAESLESFKACLHFDPHAAMCHWGVAYTLGPFLNVISGAQEEVFPVFGPRQFQQAHEAAQQAVQAAQQAAQHNPDSPMAHQELALCQVAAARFAAGTHIGPARDQAEREYAQAMQALGEAADDPTMLALAAEGWLNLVPWDFADPSTGDLREEARVAEGLLLRVLRLRPHHELALHLHVHLAEVVGAAHGQPEGGGASKGEESADRLAGLQPRMAHLQHMPSHLYIRVGRYHDAVLANFQAYSADVEAAKGCLQSYIPEHNLHMLMYATSMAGQLSVAEDWGGKLWGIADVMPRSAWPGRERTMLLLTQVRFAVWDKVLATPAPTKFERGPGDPDGHTFAVAAWHYARCLALASMAQRVQQAQHESAARRHRQEAAAELELVQDVVAGLPPDAITRPGQLPGIYSPGYAYLGAVAVKLAQARLLALDGRWHDAAAALRAAADIEQGEGYIEPPRLLHQPVLQCLGWVFLHMGRYDDAVQAYRGDLRAHPGNGWALLGLAQALMRSGHSREAAKAREQFQEAWQHADQQITCSCPAFAE